MIKVKAISPGQRGYLLMAEGTNVCRSVAKGSPGWACTRVPGHKGRHAAHGFDKQYATWHDTDCKIANAGKSRTRR